MKKSTENYEKNEWLDLDGWVKFTECISDMKKLYISAFRSRIKTCGFLL